MKKRIIGIDVARALAVIGMIIVNFKVVFGENGLDWVKSFAGIFEGKSAATFVVLAGVGLALMSNSALINNDQIKLKIVRKRMLKRALFLFFIGLSYMPIWPADILHFYGIYMLFIVLLLTRKAKIIIVSALVLIMVFPILLLFLDYETGWNFNTLNYQDFWSINGFLRNLFYNGFHPVIPWAAFILFGYWFGKQDLRNESFIKKMFWRSSIVFISIQLISKLSIAILSGDNLELVKELTEILGTNPMPPLPIYMFNGISFSFALISACIIVANRFENNKIINALNKTGQLALTFYVAHVIIGMGIVEILNPLKIGKYSIEFSVIYAFGFSSICVLFAVFWRKYKKSGPLEWMMRKLTD